MVKKILMAGLIPSVLVTAIALYFFAPPSDFCWPLVIFVI